MDGLRLAEPGDEKGILDIYRPYIEGTSFTFETEVPTEEKFSERIIEYMENWPWLVYETGGMIAGYAYASRYRERTAYQWCTETSVYIHRDHFRKGIARALYNALFEILKKQGFRNVYAVINLPNDQSVAFHESCGFNWFATYEQVGYKLGRWKNVGWWRLIINEFTEEPAPPVFFSKLDKSFIPGLLADQAAIIKS
jgi:phosphinothricin acetyltransferase